MSTEDRINNKAQDLGGKAKAAAGNLTGDDDLAQQGRNDQAKAGVKDAVHNVKESAKDAINKVKHAAHKD